MTKMPHDRFSLRQRRGDLLLAGGLAAFVLVGLLAMGVISLEFPEPAIATPPSSQNPVGPVSGSTTTAPPVTVGQAPTPTTQTVTVTGTTRPEPKPAPELPPTDGPGTTPMTRPVLPAPSPPRPDRVLIRARVRPVGACIEVFVGIPPVRTCRRS